MNIILFPLKYSSKKWNQNPGLEHSNTGGVLSVPLSNVYNTSTKPEALLEISQIL